MSQEEKVLADTGYTGKLMYNIMQMSIYNVLSKQVSPSPVASGVPGQISKWSPPSPFPPHSLQLLFRSYTHIFIHRKNGST